jgi:hypothetical protein
MNVWLRRPTLLGDWMLTPSLGASLATGGTGEDPFALTERGLRHQHMQFGTGTVVPQAGVDLVGRFGRWGALVQASGRVPVYEGSNGYLAPSSLSGGAGPAFSVTPQLYTWLLAEAAYESTERWYGTDYGGRAGVSASVGALYSFRPGLSGQLSVRVPLWEAVHHADQDASVNQPLSVALGLSWAFGEGLDPEP